MDVTPDQILQRLEELRRWQEEQRNALNTRQIAQREMLHLEKNKLYEMFGVSMNSTMQNEATSESDVLLENDDGGQDDGSHMHPGLLEEIQKCEEQKGPSAQSVVKDVNPNDEQHKDPVSKHDLITISEESLDVNESSSIDNIPKRSFLRRGEGLHARFKVHPNELRLNNLPKYKFAGAHQKLSRRKHHQPPVDPLPTENAPEQPVVKEIPRTPILPVSSTQTRGEPWNNVLIKEAMQPMRQTRGNISVQDTPTRQLIRQQQREIDELNLFEHLEANMQSDFTHDSSSIQPSYSADTSLCAPGPGRVQFMSQVQINEATEISDSETIDSTDLNDIPTNQTSTPNTRTAFQAFKTQLFGNASLASSSHQTPNDTTLVGEDTCPAAAVPAMAFIQQQSVELKQKLLELELEMDLFRTQNSELTKVQQQLELDRVQLDAERTDIEERLNDERCKMEVYLHDERIKLLADKEALDRRAKELRAPNRKERDETTQLRAQVTALEAELVAKEQRHVAAQGRLRAQIRTMEKDLKEYSFEVENMKKENKKLEAENVRLRRQSNNKMLNEINKNIARLAVVPTKDNPDAGKKTPKTPASKPAPKSMPVRSRSVGVSSSSSSSESDITDEPVTASNYFHADSPSNVAKALPAQQQHSSTNVVNSAQPAVVDQQQNCKREILNDDGSRDILYPNGNMKKVSKDAMLIRMLYFNKDVKETNITEGTVKYYYAATNTWHTSYLDGLEILEFPK